MTLAHRIEHELVYGYVQPVRGSVMTLFVRPRESTRQTLEHFRLETDPSGHVREFTDGFGNRGHFFTRHHPHGRLRIAAGSRVRVSRPAPLPDAIGPDSRAIPGMVAGVPGLQLMLQPSRFVRPGSHALANFLSAHRIERGNDLLVSLRTLASRLFEIFEYAPGTTAADSPIDRVLETGRGVCQDYTHVMASVARRWGIPARYVSGYLAPDSDGNGLGESHSWVECWLPELGWIGFDPANDCLCDDRHVRVAVGRDYADVPPSRGIFYGRAVSTLATRVTVTRGECGRRSDAPFDFSGNSNHRSTKPCDSTTSSLLPAAFSRSRLPLG